MGNRILEKRRMGNISSHDSYRKIKGKKKSRLTQARGGWRDLRAAEHLISHGKKWVSIASKSERRDVTGRGEIQRAALDPF